MCHILEEILLILLTIILFAILYVWLINYVVEMLSFCNKLLKIVHLNITNNILYNFG